MYMSGKKTNQFFMIFEGLYALAKNNMNRKMVRLTAEGTHTIKRQLIKNYNVNLSKSTTSMKNKFKKLKSSNRFTWTLLHVNFDTIRL